MGGNAGRGRPGARVGSPLCAQAGAGLNQLGEAPYQLLGCGAGLGVAAGAPHKQVCHFLQGRRERGRVAAEVSCMPLGSTRAQAATEVGACGAAVLSGRRASTGRDPPGYDSAGQVLAWGHSDGT